LFLLEVDDKKNPVTDRIKIAVSGAALFGWIHKKGLRHIVGFSNILYNTRHTRMHMHIMTADLMVISKQLILKLQFFRYF